MASLLWLTPSPRWLTLHGRRSEATAVWDYLDVSQAEREKIEIEQTQSVNTEAVASASSDIHAPSVYQRQDRSMKHKFFDLFSKDVRTRTAPAVFLMGMQQLSGIDGVLYVGFQLFLLSSPADIGFKYAPLLFEQAGLASSDASFFASGVSAIVIFAVTIPALIWADRWGRRHSTIYGGIGLAVTMFLIGGTQGMPYTTQLVQVGGWSSSASIFLQSYTLSAGQLASRSTQQRYNHKGPAHQPLAWHMAAIGPLIFWSH